MDMTHPDALRPSAAHATTAALAGVWSAGGSQVLTISAAAGTHASGSSAKKDSAGFGIGMSIPLPPACIHDLINRRRSVVREADLAAGPLPLDLGAMPQAEAPRAGGLA